MVARTAASPKPLVAKIEASEQALQKIFSSDFDFSIPLYQRPYAWTTKETGELLSDLFDNMGSLTTAVDETDPYFLGSLVLIKGDSPEADVVDGQQRLTTLTILFSALRTLLAQDEAEGITELLYEKANPIKGTQNRYRLTLRTQDATFFQDYIQHVGGIDKLKTLSSVLLPDSQANIRDNGLLLLQQLAKRSPGERSRLAQFAARRCYLVAVRTATFNSAYRIFSVLNSRGLNLTTSDILKAEMIGDIPAPQQQDYTQKWEDTEDALGRDGFQELFAHIRMIYRKAKLAETVLDEYKNHILPHQNTADFIDKVIIPYGDAYEIIKTASYQSATGADPVNEMLTWLNRIDNSDWIPLAILYFSKHSNSPDELAKFLVSLERLAAGHMILRRNINERINRYAQVLSVIDQGSDVFATASPLQLTDIEKQEITDVLNSDNLYGESKIRMYVLLRLDSALSQGQAVYNYPIITVEHVLPQTPAAGSKWLTWYADDLTRSRYTNRLSNLVLLARKKNSQAQNFEFDVKKQKYFTTAKGISPFVLTTQVLGEKEWTTGVQDKRQKELVAILKTTWTLA
jgi:hypothetical protein